MKKFLKIAIILLGASSMAAPVQPLLAQAGWLPFHWAWRDFAFSDLFAKVQDLEVITITPQGKRKPDQIQYQRITFDSLGRSINETYFTNDELASGTTHQIVWLYDEAGCPHKQDLENKSDSSVLAMPYSSFGRFVCKSGNLFQARGEWNGLNAITQYEYSPGQIHPSRAIIYQNSMAWNPTVAMDTLHYRYDSIGRCIGYSSAFQNMSVVFSDHNSQTAISFTHADGSSLEMYYYIFRSRIPWEITVLKRRKPNAKASLQSTIYFLEH